MDSTAGFGRFVGWACIALGAAAVAVGAMADTELARVQLLTAGFSAVGAGVLFLLLAGILATLVQIQQGQDARRYEREYAAQAAARRLPREAPPAGMAPARYAHPAETKPASAAPTRFELQQRYGEPLGNAAHALIHAAGQRGETLGEQEAVTAARAELARHD